MSARLSSSSGSRPSPGASATPTLAPTTTWWPSDLEGRPRAPRPGGAARASAASGWPAPAWRTANSSPPRRATVSPSRTQARRRAATARSSASPTGWPSVSLTVLEAVEVEAQHRQPARPGAAPPPAPARAGPGTAPGSAGRSARRGAPGARSAPPCAPGRARSRGTPPALPPSRRSRRSAPARAPASRCRPRRGGPSPRSSGSAAARRGRRRGSPRGRRRRRPARPARRPGRGAGPPS